MKRKFIAVIAVLLILPAVLFATPVVVTWEWLLEDPLVTTFRYQVDGEDEANWTVVDSSVTSYVAEGLDGSMAHTLYLQQSYDGIHFSGSAQSVAEAMFPAEAAVPEVASQPMAEVQPVEPVVEQTVVPVAEDAVVVEPQPEETVVEAAPVEEVVQPVVEPTPVAEVVQPVAEPVTETAVQPAAETVVAEPAPTVAAQPVATEPEPVKKESRYSTTITLGGTGSYMFTAMTGYHGLNAQAELGIQLNNLITFNKNFGLGVDLGFAYSPFLSSTYGWRTVISDILAFDFATPFSNLTHAGTVTIAPMINMSLGKVDFDLGVGGFFTYGPSLSTTNGDAYLYGAFAKAALAYNFNKVFSLGVSGKYGYILSEGTSSFPTYAEATAYMGFSF